MAETSVSRYYKRKKRKKKIKKIVFFVMLFLTVVITAAILSMTVFFNIKTIEVNKESGFDKDEILSVCNIKIDDNLFRINKGKARKLIMKKYAQASDVNFKISLPDKLIINIKRAEQYAYFEHNKSFYIIDESFKVLDQLKTDKKIKVPKIYGKAVETAKVGQQIKMKDETAIDNIKTILDQVKANLGLKNVNVVNLSNPIALKVAYDNNRIEINLGGYENVEKKLQLVKFVIDENPKSESAKIDVSSGKRAYYKPNL